MDVTGRRGRRDGRAGLAMLDRRVFQETKGQRAIRVIKALKEPWYIVASRMV